MQYSFYCNRIWEFNFVAITCETESLLLGVLILNAKLKSFQFSSWKSALKTGNFSSVDYNLITFTQLTEDFMNRKKSYDFSGKMSKVYKFEFLLTNWCFTWSLNKKCLITTDNTLNSQDLMSEFLLTIYHTIQIS